MSLKREALDLISHLHNIPGVVQQCYYDPEFTIIFMSDGFFSMFGYTREDIGEKFHNHYMELIHPEDRERVAVMTKQQLSFGDTFEYDYRVIRKDGSIGWVLEKGKLVREEDGTETLYCLLLDHTYRKEEQEELRLSLERHRLIMDQTTDIIFEWDIKSDTLEFSSNWYKKFGYQPIVEHISQSIPLSPNIHAEDIPAFIKFMKDTASGIPYSETELRIRDSCRDFTWCKIRATLQFDDGGRPIKAVGVIVDIDADKKQKEILQKQAERDSLTGILNKVATQKQVEVYLNCLTMDSGALFLLDLDGFKGVNDGYGHLCGDTVLTDVADILKKMSRASDVVGRIGGDEFLIFFPNIREKDAARKAEEVIHAVRNIKIGKLGNVVNCSIGIAYYPYDAKTYSELFLLADRALYHAKFSGKGVCSEYRPIMCAKGLFGRIPESSTGTAVDSDDAIVNEKLGQYCFRMLYHTIDTESAISQMLEIAGRVYQVSRVYIYENTVDESGCVNTFEWCNDEGNPEISTYKKIPSQEDVEEYLANFDDNGVFYCRDIKSLDPYICDVFERQGIRSVLQCIIKDEGRFMGFVGFDENEENRCWTREQVNSLALIANVLSVFLIKLRYREKIKKDEIPCEMAIELMHKKRNN